MELYTSTTYQTGFNPTGELRKNGYEVITGKRIVKLKNIVGPLKFEGTKTSRIGAFDFKSFLNLSMLLTGSDVAEKMRNKFTELQK